MNDIFTILSHQNEITLCLDLNTQLAIYQNDSEFGSRRYVEIPENSGQLTHIAKTMLSTCGIYPRLIEYENNILSLTISDYQEIVIDENTIRVGITLLNRSAHDHLEFMLNPIGFLCDVEVLKLTARRLNDLVEPYEKVEPVYRETKMPPTYTSTEFGHDDFQRIIMDAANNFDGSGDFDELVKNPATETRMSKIDLTKINCETLEK